MSYLWSAPPNPSPSLRTVLTYLYASEQCDDKKLADTLDQTLEHSILPQSLHRPQVLSKSLYLEYFREFGKMFQKPIRRTIHEVIEMGDHIVVHASANGQSITGHEYNNEYMIVFRLMASSTGDGSRKIASVKEFADSQASSSFIPAERRRIAAAEAEARAAARATQGQSNLSRTRR